MIDADVHPFCGPQIGGLIAETTSIQIPVKYANFAFSPDLTSKLLKYTTTMLSN